MPRAPETNPEELEDDDPPLAYLAAHVQRAPEHGGEALAPTDTRHLLKFRQPPPVEHPKQPREPFFAPGGLAALAIIAAWIAFFSYFGPSIKAFGDAILDPVIVPFVDWLSSLIR